MSSVLKSLQNLSEMEFYKNAIRMRTSLTVWLLKDFGTRRNPRSVNKVIRDISMEDKHVIDEIFAKYGKSPNKEFQSEYPSWFVEYEREVIVKILQDIIGNITSANSIFPSDDFLKEEYGLRRKYQDMAITECYRLYQELQYIADCFNTDLNRFVPFLEAVEKEIDLLKGWRQSDNKKRKERKKKIEEKKSKKGE